MAQVKINPKLNLVIPVETDGGLLYVHAVPISNEVFERYYLVISKAFSAIHREGLGDVAGPRVAKMVLLDVAARLGTLEDVQQGLIAEINRLANVLVLGSGGWSPIPLHDAMRDGFLSAEDISEVENALAFFTVLSSMHKRKILDSILDGAASLWGALIVSSSCMEFAASLETSTETEPLAEKVIPSSIPS
jgi:hypothetical protein